MINPKDTFAYKAMIVAGLISFYVIVIMCLLDLLLLPLTAIVGSGEWGMAALLAIIPVGINLGFALYICPFITIFCLIILFYLFINKISFQFRQLEIHNKIKIVLSFTIPAISFFLFILPFVLGFISALFLRILIAVFTALILCLIPIYISKKLKVKTGIIMLLKIVFCVLLLLNINIFVSLIPDSYQEVKLRQNIEYKQRHQIQETNKTPIENIMFYSETLVAPDGIEYSGRREPPRPGFKPITK